MDNYELENGGVIYPLFKFNLEGKDYLFYSIKEKDITKEDIFVGEEKDDSILPVSEELLLILEQKYEEIINMLIDPKNII